MNQVCVYHRNPKIRISFMMGLFLACIVTFDQIQAQTTMVWSENWEGNYTNNWTVEGPPWQIGILKNGPGKAHEGEKCAGTNLESNYPAKVDSGRLVRYREFTVPDTINNPRLRIWHWFDFSHKDYGVVQIKAGAQAWKNISEIYTWTGSGVWTYACLDLAPYAGQRVQIGFLFHAEDDPGIYGIDVSSGWFVDEVALITGPYTFNGPESFEAGYGDWCVNKGTWEIGKPAAGPSAVHSGANCAGTVLGGNYRELVDSRLSGPPITIPPASQNPRLRFWHWFDFSHKDYGVVQIKVGTGAWENMPESYIWTGSDVWTYTCFDLAPYAGQRVQVGFFLHAEDDPGIYGGDVSTGWYIDEVAIVTGPYTFNNPESFETGYGDWYVNKGTWEIGEPTAGPSAVHSGANCAGSVLGGNYRELVDSRLSSPPINIPPASQNPRLRFWHWYDFSHMDYGAVQIKVGAQDWTDISDKIQWTGSGVWSFTAINLLPYAGQRVQIGFFLHAEDDPGIYGGDVSTGWYIDDLRIDTGSWTITRYDTVTFEEGWGNWYGKYGTWEVGVPTAPNGPSSAYSPPNCAGTVLSGNYGAGVESRLITPKIEIPSSATDIEFWFYHWYSFNSLDYGELEIKKNDQPIENIDTAKFLNESGPWLPSRIPLEAGKYAGSTIQIRFHFHSEDDPSIYGSDVNSGWYIDDFVIIWSDSGVSRNISIPDTCSTPGSKISIPVNFTSWKDIAGAEIKLTYRASVINIESATAAQGLGITLVDTTSTGKCAIALARPTGLPAGGGTLFYLNCHVPGNAVIGDTTLIKFAEARFYDENTNAVKVAHKNGIFTVIPEDTLDSIAVEPPSATLRVNEKLTLIAKGYNRQKQPVPCSLDWSVEIHCGDIGTIDPSPGSTKSFTASGPGHGLIIAKHGTVSGSAIIVVGMIRGDVKLDNKVDVQDAIKCLQLAPDHPIFTGCPYQLWAADCDSSGGKPDENDAQCILRKTVNSMLPKNLIRTGPAYVSMGLLQMQEDGSITVPVLVRERPDISAAGITIRYSQDNLVFKNVTPTCKSSLIVSNVVEAGLVEVSSIDAATLINNQEIWLNLIFSPKAPLSEITIPTIQQVRLFSYDCQPVEAIIRVGPPPPPPPDYWQLYQNHPNPFNPSTSIGYDLTAAAPVELQVYNAVGQFVATLVKATLAAGSHVAQWDGTDSAGHPVPAGVYFCRMTVDHGAWSKVTKMLLIK